MASEDQLTRIPETALCDAEIDDLEAALGYTIPEDLRAFIGTFGYSSFIDIGYGGLAINGHKAAFGQFYGKRPGKEYDPRDFDSGALRLGDAKSHYPESSLIFAGDELGGEYFIQFGEKSGIYWMIYGESSDFLKVCNSFNEFLSLIQVEPYDD